MAHKYTLNKTLKDIKKTTTNYLAALWYSSQIFFDIHTQYLKNEWLAEREKAILATKNVDVNDMNFKMQHLLLEDLVSYKSIDTVCDSKEAVNYPTEFLNSLDLPRLVLR
ncbi:unnamed protein product [Euphydryas editha]|uniref:Uncharacterized protein n=1 Tax=Euphydryas editha TaxID=104508 RepID=A0AAU9TS72_EUPED|nr:unnamed protein product [Euphydryas editha]